MLSAVHQTDVSSRPLPTVRICIPLSLPAMFAGNSLSLLGKDWQDLGLGWDSPGDKSMEMGAAFQPLQDVWPQRLGQEEGSGLRDEERDPECMAGRCTQAVPLGTSWGEL